VTTLDDFLSENEEAILSMAIADRILLARSLLDSVASTLIGNSTAPEIGEDDQDYEIAEEEDY
jgi:hypothetical protein